MDSGPCICPPQDADDTAGAIRVFDEFLGEYKDLLSRAEQYFTHIMDHISPQFSEGYAPWRNAARDLLQGVYFVSRKLPMRNPKGLADALRLFSLDSAVAMLEDICVSCKIKLSRQWAEIFRRNMQALGQAFRVLMSQRVIALGR